MVDFDAPIPARDEPVWAEVEVVPIRDDGEPLLPLGLCRGLDVWPAYRHYDVPGALSECYVRASVLERLLIAGRSLPAGLRLVVLDAWRPLEVQAYLHRCVTQLVSERDASIGMQERCAVVRQFVAAPQVSRAPSPHLTGGAVDVSLCDAEGRFLDMGTPFDAVTDASAIAWYEANGIDDAKSGQARRHRRLLHGAMTSAGFSSLPSEWWHYDFGNQLWAWSTRQPPARYGAVELALPDTLKVARGPRRFGAN